MQGDVYETDFWLAGRLSVWLILKLALEPDVLLRDKKGGQVKEEEDWVRRKVGGSYARPRVNNRNVTTRITHYVATT